MRFTGSLNEVICQLNPHDESTIYVPAMIESVNITYDYSDSRYDRNLQYNRMDICLKVQSRDWSYHLSHFKTISIFEVDKKWEREPFTAMLMVIPIPALLTLQSAFIKNAIHDSDGYTCIEISGYGIEQ